MLTEQQILLRRQFVGASDAPAICGVDPYRTVADIWAAKRGLVRDTTSAAASRGNWLEPALLDFARHEIGRDFNRNTMIIDDDGVMAVNFDGLGDDFIVEGKTSVIREGWGEPETDEVPERVAVQVAAAFKVAGPQVVRCYVPALIAMDLRIYVIERDDSLVDAVSEACHWFHRDVMPSPEPPEGSQLSIDILKHIDRIPEKAVPIDAAMVDRLKKAKEKLKAAEEEEEAAKLAVIQALGDAEAGVPGGAASSEIVTYNMATRRGIDNDKLKRSYAEAAAACERITKYRTLRIKALKAR